MPMQAMGCAASGVKVNSGQEGDLKNILSKDQIILVQKTWSFFRQDIENIGLVIFKRLFAQSKQLKKLFRSRLRMDDDVYDEYGDIMFDEQKIRDHARIVMEALGSAVECLNNSEKLTAVLIGIGERHVIYGVQPDMIPLLWPPIITTFEERLGSAFTSKIGQAWENVFTYISKAVTDGMCRWPSESEVSNTESALE